MTQHSTPEQQTTHPSKDLPLIDLKHVNKYYHMGENTLHVLKDITVQIYPGQFVSIMGPSGSGKSTLINVIGFLDNEFDGDYDFQGKPATHRSDKEISKLRNKKVGFVFQDFNLIENMSVAQNVALPLLYAGQRESETTDRVQYVLQRVGIGDKMNNKPYELSGGQRQRVAIARALVNQPEFIIADEPTGALDTKTSAVIMDILQELNEKENVTILVVTHDPSLQRYANRHLMITDGYLKESSEAEVTQLVYELSQQELEKEAREHEKNTSHQEVVEEEKGD